jgi:hypothetical protein
LIELAKNIFNREKAFYLEIFFYRFDLKVKTIIEVNAHK